MCPCMCASASPVELRVWCMCMGVCMLVYMGVSVAIGEFFVK